MIARRLRSWISEILLKLIIQTWSSMTVQENHSIKIVDMRMRSNNFQTTIVAALELLKNTDNRRYHRVTNSFDWVVNQSLSSPGATYHHQARACIINFEEPWPGRDEEFSIGFHAALLIHEATHAYLECRGIPYDEMTRVRIESLCVKEQNRWVENLGDGELGERLHQNFDPEDWKFYWNESRFELLKATLRNAIHIAKK